MRTYTDIPNNYLSSIAGFFEHMTKNIDKKQDDFESFTISTLIAGSRFTGGQLWKNR